MNTKPALNPLIAQQVVQTARECAIQDQTRNAPAVYELLAGRWERVITFTGHAVTLASTKINPDCDTTSLLAYKMIFVSTYVTQAVRSAVVETLVNEIGVLTANAQAHADALTAMSRADILVPGTHSEDALIHQTERHVRDSLLLDGAQLIAESLGVGSEVTEIIAAEQHGV